jgi:hypothetical protein
MASYVYVLSKYWRVFMRWLRSTPLILVVMSGIMLFSFCTANFLRLFFNQINPESIYCIFCGPYLLFAAAILLGMRWAWSPGGLGMRMGLFSVLFGCVSVVLYFCCKTWLWVAPSIFKFEFPSRYESKSFSILFTLSLAVFTVCQCLRTFAGFRLQHARNVQRIAIKRQTSILELLQLTFIVAASLRLSFLNHSHEWNYTIAQYFVVNLLFVFVYLLPIAYYLLRDIDYPFTYSLLIAFCSLYFVFFIYLLLHQLTLRLFQLEDKLVLGVDDIGFSTALGFSAFVIPLALLRRDHFELRTWRDD